jgi:hypothetical protein
LVVLVLRSAEESWSEEGEEEEEGSFKPMFWMPEVTKTRQVRGEDTLMVCMGRSIGPMGAIMPIMPIMPPKGKALGLPRL